MSDNTLPARFESLPTSVLQNVSRFLGVRDLGNYQLLNQATNVATRGTYQRVREMAMDNGYHSQLPPQLRKNFWREIETIKALIDSGLVAVSEVQVWGQAPAQVQSVLAAQFESAGYHPDAVIRDRPADFFTSNLPDTSRMQVPEGQRGAVMVRKALEALNTQIPKEVKDKWRHYGPNTIVVANVSDYPAELSTHAIFMSLVPLAVGRTSPHQSLWIVRGFEAVMIF
jgi:hypothetical protein